MNIRLKNLETLRESYNLKNGEKGITLIALIVTIIVLLILAMVSVNLILRENLIKKAQYAADEYDKGAQQEPESLNIFEEEINAIVGGLKDSDDNGEDNNTPEKNQYGYYENVVYKYEQDGVGYYYLFGNNIVKNKILYSGTTVSSDTVEGIQIKENQTYVLSNGENIPIEGFVIEAQNNLGNWYPWFKINDDTIQLIISVRDNKNGGYSNINIQTWHLSPDFELSPDEVFAETN